MKKIGLILGLLLVLALAGGGSWYLWQTKIKPRQAPVFPTASPSATAPLLNWDDPAGFTFAYPQGIILDKHDEDQENYAHLELTHKDHPGNLIIWAKDTTAVDITAWVRTEKTLAQATILDTTLGEQPAKKILITSPQPKVVIGTIYDELLYLVEASPVDKVYWDQVFTQVINSLAFKPPEYQSAASQSLPASEAVVDEEEVIE